MFFIKHPANKIKNGLIKQWDTLSLKNKLFKIEDTIIVTGSPRSGTTWVMELLSCIPEYMSIFEPLNINWFPEAKKAGFKPRTYIPWHEDHLEIKQYLNSVFNGKIVSLRNRYRISREILLQRLKAKKMLIKFIRANRLLPWLIQNFTFRAIIFVIRHPCATIASQLKTGIRGYFLAKNVFPLKKTIVQDTRAIESLDKDILTEIENIQTEEEILALIWALDHYIPLSSPSHKWIIVSYENLVSNGKDATRKIFDYLGEVNYSNKSISKLKKYSITSNQANKVEKNNYVLYKWKKNLSKIQVNRITKVLSWFDISFDDKTIQIGKVKLPVLPFMDKDESWFL